MFIHWSSVSLLNLHSTSTHPPSLSHTHTFIEGKIVNHNPIYSQFNILIDTHEKTLFLSLALVFLLLFYHFPSFTCSNFPRIYFFHPNNYFLFNRERFFKRLLPGPSALSASLSCAMLWFNLNHEMWISSTKNSFFLSLKNVFLFCLAWRYQISTEIQRNIFAGSRSKGNNFELSFKLY